MKDVVIDFLIVDWCGVLIKENGMSGGGREVEENKLFLGMIFLY